MNKVMMVDLMLNPECYAVNWCKYLFFKYPHKKSDKELNPVT
jgi:hypothetical protein